jgi:hypothetical protein
MAEADLFSMMYRLVTLKKRPLHRVRYTAKTTRTSLAVSYLIHALIVKY